MSRDKSTLDILMLNKKHLTNQHLVVKDMCGPFYEVVTSARNDPKFKGNHQRKLIIHIKLGSSVSVKLAQ